MMRLGLAVLFWLTAVTAVAADLPTTSLYTVPLSFRDQQGRTTSLDSFRGAPVVLTLAYTRCQSACPLTMGRLKKVARELAASTPETRFVVVSLDPEHDTPATLLAFQRQYRLSEREWHLLTGEASEVRKLSVLLGYSYQQPAGSTEIAHSNKIVALDRAGVIAAQLEGLEGGIEAFAAEVARLAVRQ